MLVQRGLDADPWSSVTIVEDPGGAGSHSSPSKSITSQSVTGLDLTLPKEITTDEGKSLISIFMKQLCRVLTLNNSVDHCITFRRMIEAVQSNLNGRYVAATVNT